MAFLNVTKGTELIVGRRIFGKHRAIFYVALVTLSAPLFITRGTSTDHWARIFGASLWTAFFLLFWIQISSMLWMLRTGIRDSFVLFVLKIIMKVVASILLSILLLALSLRLAALIFPLVAKLFGHPDVGVDYPSEDVARIGNNWLGFVLAIYYLSVKIKFLMCLSITIIPVIFAVLSTICLVLLKIILAPFRVPLQIVLDRMVISDKGVLTQLGIGLAAVAKILQEVLKYLMHKS